jgi:hypothetical protein
VKAKRFGRKPKPLLYQGNDHNGGIALCSIKRVLGYVEVPDHLYHERTAFRIPVETLHTDRRVVPVATRPDPAVWVDGHVLRNIAPAFHGGVELVDCFYAGYPSVNRFIRQPGVVHVNSFNSPCKLKLGDQIVELIQS